MPHASAKPSMLCPHQPCIAPVDAIGPLSSLLPYNPYRPLLYTPWPCQYGTDLSYDGPSKSKSSVGLCFPTGVATLSNTQNLHVRKHIKRTGSHDSMISTASSQQRSSRIDRTTRLTLVVNRNSLFDDHHNRKLTSTKDNAIRLHDEKVPPTYFHHRKTRIVSYCRCDPVPS
jgi:hypothetical protein